VVEVVRDKLLGGVELAAGSARWGNNRRRLPLARFSQRKSHGLASLVGAAGRLLVQEGHGDEALLLD
jgi:hypothetical protein